MVIVFLLKIVIFVCLFLSYCLVNKKKRKINQQQHERKKNRKKKSFNERQEDTKKKNIRREEIGHTNKGKKENVLL